MAKVGIVGISGYGGAELLRLCAGHPSFRVTHAYGDSTAGQRVGSRFPATAGHPIGDLVIEPFEPEDVKDVDVLFVSLPTGRSRELLRRVDPKLRVIDVGGDHRFVPGWVYGLTELPGQRERIRAALRLANPGCYPAAVVLALAPLAKAGLIEMEGIVIDAKSGITGTGRGGSSDFGFVETNEDMFAYGLVQHPHVPEMQSALAEVSGRICSLAFTANYVPLSRGILAACYAQPRGELETGQLLDAARAMYGGEPFVKVVAAEEGRSPRTHWATGTNLAFLSYVVNRETGLAVAIGAIDNLGKGAAAQAIQNANLMTDQPETAGLTALPILP